MADIPRCRTIRPECRTPKNPDNPKVLFVPDSNSAVSETSFSACSRGSVFRSLRGQVSRGFRDRSHRAVDRAPACPKLALNGAITEALRAQRLDRSIVSEARAAEATAFSYGMGESRHRSFANQGAFEFRESP
jgi:hypothetical protein